MTENEAIEARKSYETFMQLLGRAIYGFLSLLALCVKGTIEGKEKTGGRDLLWLCQVMKGGLSHPGPEYEDPGANFPMLEHLVNLIENSSPAMGWLIGSEMFPMTNSGLFSFLAKELPKNIMIMVMSACSGMRPLIVGVRFVTPDEMFEESGPWEGIRFVEEVWGEDGDHLGGKFYREKLQVEYRGVKYARLREQLWTNWNTVKSRIQLSIASGNQRLIDAALAQRDLFMAGCPLLGVDRKRYAVVLTSKPRSAVEFQSIRPRTGGKK